MDPRFALALFNLGGVYGQKRMYAQAMDCFESGLRISDTDASAIAELGYTYGQAGQQEKARSCLLKVAKLSTGRYIAPYFYAMVHASLGNHDEAFRLLRESLNDRSTPMTFLNVDPRWDILRSDARFSSILTHLALA